MYNLICVHPFGIYDKGQKITDPDEVARLMKHRDHHFVRVPAPDEPKLAMPSEDVIRNPASS